MSNPTTTDSEAEELRQKIRDAMVCEDREHLESADEEACYNCQVDKVLAIVQASLARAEIKGRLAELERKRRPTLGFRLFVWITTVGIRREITQQDMKFLRKMYKMTGRQPDAE